MTARDTQHPPGQRPIADIVPQVVCLDEDGLEQFAPAPSLPAPPRTDEPTAPVIETPRPQAAALVMIAPGPAVGRAPHHQTHSLRAAVVWIVVAVAVDALVGPSSPDVTRGPRVAAPPAPVTMETRAASPEATPAGIVPAVRRVRHTPPPEPTPARVRATERRVRAADSGQVVPPPRPARIGDVARASLPPPGPARATAADAVPATPVATVAGAVRPAANVAEDAPVAVTVLDHPPVAAVAEARLAPARASAAPAVAPPPRDGDASAIERVLGRYRTAFNELDAVAASAVWPTVNEKSLARAFDRLEDQDMAFDDCRIEVLAGMAEAACHGRARYVPKVGSRTPKAEARRWTFSLHKASSGWLIDRVDAR